MAEVQKAHLVEIGKRIKKAREAARKTQKEVAEHLAIHLESYNYIEKGKRDLKTAEIISLSKYIGVSTDYILSGIEQDKANSICDIGLNNAFVSSLRKNKDDIEVIFFLNRLLNSSKINQLASHMIDYQNLSLTILQNKDVVPEEDLEFAFKRHARHALELSGNILEEVFTPTSIHDEAPYNPNRSLESSQTKKIVEMKLKDMSPTQLEAALIVLRILERLKEE